jgi:hypothetical protein
MNWSPDEILRQLRKIDAKAQVCTGQEGPYSVFGAAADEIERLRGLYGTAADEASDLRIELRLLKAEPRACKKCDAPHCFCVQPLPQRGEG